MIKLFKIIIFPSLFLVVVVNPSSSQTFNSNLQNSKLQNGSRNKILIKAMLTAGITAGLYSYDQKIKNWVQKHRSKSSDRISEFFRFFGDGKKLKFPLFIFYSYGYFFKNKKVKKTTILCLESFLVSGTITTVIKYAGHRHRPNTNDPYDRWDGPGFSNLNLSFPSGHSSTAFSIATVIASEYDNIFLIQLLSYGTATLTALSRVNDNAHWASDVFFGSAIGYFTAKAIISLNRSKNEKKVFLPVINNRYSGLLILYTF
ncbi:hypothetical protein DRQ09_01960 [candidate division KSB1 bacterium]|nr:MAG: hypothetical protein DRQ09_01960 [candidate division KSB1 bacterium]